MPNHKSEHESSGGNVRKILFIICAVAVAAAVIAAAIILINRANGKKRAEEQRELLSEMISATLPPLEESPDEVILTPEPTEGSGTPAPTPVQYEILDDYKMLYDLNPYMIGWLKVDDTVIDYPVVKTPEDQTMYLYKNFMGEDDVNGTLYMNINSIVGVGTKELEYKDGFPPSTNMLIYGHTMKSGEMFGNLNRYESEEYGKAHRIIRFDSLFEKREYELISCFYSQVYDDASTAFKYYEFYQADTQEEFDYWYNNIKELSLYDTGVTAELGDEFITLTCCAYHVENGRFVVVAKRIV